MPKSTNRYSSTLLGLAVGDALGTTLEFRARGTFEPITDMDGGGPFHLKPGEWTDDTSMALCLAESLVELGGFDPIDQLHRYCKWWRHGHLSSNGTCFDIGGTVSSALRRFEETGKREPRCGSTDPHTAGNGSIMRLAPVVLYYAKDPALAIDYAAKSSLTTHGAPEAVDACRLMAAVLIQALRGRSKREICFGPFQALDASCLAPKIAALGSGEWANKSRDEIRGTGYVVDALEAALWCFWHTTSYREAVLAAANLGDDADTTAAICGQIAGAHYGIEGIPEAWLSKLTMQKEIARFADELEVGPAPLERSYWALPGQLLAGAYPGDPQASVARSKVKRLIEAGVRVFVNLMEPDETNNQGQTFAPYDDLVAQEAAAAGVSARCVRHPIPDLGVPPAQRMREIDATLVAARDAGECVYVHCWGGRGRTGTVAGIELCRAGVATREDFVEVIRRRRRFDKGGGGSPENAGQVAFVREWVGK